MPIEREPLLIVDDDKLIVELLCDELADDFEPVGVYNRTEVAGALRQLGSPPRYALVDLGLPPHANGPQEGFALVRDLVATVPNCAIVVVSGQNELEHAKVARALGAIDFIAKPCDPATIRAALHRARDALEAATGEHAILGNSVPVTLLRSQIKQFATATYPVLIEGESGTGKELVARALHQLSGLTGNFVAINCAALPATLFEATLFGSKRGAYTGATADSEGFFAEATHGSLLLDEIGELPHDLQAKLLRVLETGEYHRLGESKVQIAKVRIIAATNQSLVAAIRQGSFREDLYHRLGVLALKTPPLRELGDDRQQLLDAYLTRAASHNDTPPFKFDDEANTLWLDYSFPGNVRELRNVVARLQVQFPDQVVTALQLTEQLLDVPSATSALRFATARLNEDESSLEQLQKTDAIAYIEAAVRECGDETAASERLGMSVSKLRKMRSKDK